MGHKLYKGGALEKTPFCDNPKCELHQYNVDQGILHIDIKRPGIIIGHLTSKKFNRVMLKSDDGTRHAWLCEVCDSAIDTAQDMVGEVEEKPVTHDQLLSTLSKCDRILED